MRDGNNIASVLWKNNTRFLPHGSQTSGHTWAVQTSVWMLAWMSPWMSACTSVTTAPYIREHGDSLTHTHTRSLIPEPYPHGFRYDHLWWKHHKGSGERRKKFRTCGRVWSSKIISLKYENGSGEYVTTRCEKAWRQHVSTFIDQAILEHGL